jgi:hypothetical protein
MLVAVGRRYVRFGSEADIYAAKSHVRFTPKSGHVQCTSSCLLWAKSGHLVFEGVGKPQEIFRDSVFIGQGYLSRIDLNLFHRV